MKKAMIVVLCAALCSSFITVQGQTNFTVTPSDAAAEETIPCEATVQDGFVTGEIMVGIKAAYSIVNKQWTPAHFPELSDIAGIEDLTYVDNEQAREVYEEVEEFHQLLKITIASTTKEGVIAGIAALAENEVILFAEPNSILTIEEPVPTPETGITAMSNLSLNCEDRYRKYTNDPKLEQQHGIFLHNVDKVWNGFTKGSSSVVVGVVDSGISEHVDLEANVISPAYNAVTQKNDSTHPYLTDHGTAVASIIAAIDHNGKGISGIAPNISVKSYMIAEGLNNDHAYSYDSTIAQAILRANVDKIDILNLSWEVGNNATLLTVAKMFTGLIVKTADNGGKQITANSDSAAFFDLNNVIVVGSIGKNKTISNFQISVLHMLI